MAEQKKRGLGRGFDALIPSQIEEEFDVTAKVDESGNRSSNDILREVSPNIVDPNPHQPRLSFNEGELENLADSIRVHGILQPLVVTQLGMRYELIAGERRLRAAKLVGLPTVPVIVRSFDEQQKLELALIENIQRAELNPIELATAYRKLMDQFGLTYDQMGKRVGGRDRSTIANTVRLLGLPLEAKRAVAEGIITEGLARVILTLSEEQKQLELLKLIVDKGWTVRQAEEYARGLRENAGNHEKAKARIAGVNDLTKSLGDYLGAKVQQVATAKGGKLIIEYYSEEELDRIYRAIKHEDEV
jgi:ParB family chromosome partitioning protein